MPTVHDDVTEVNPAIRQSILDNISSLPAEERDRLARAWALHLVALLDEVLDKAIARVALYPEDVAELQVKGDVFRLLAWAAGWTHEGEEVVL